MCIRDRARAGGKGRDTGVDSCMAASVLPMHSGPDGHGLDGSVKKQGYRSGHLCG